METSLAQQLRKLKTPQTSILVDSKKRASILFDEKEAAEKDRETIFDIGYSGFIELVALNPAFMQFESALFDKNARELQRAVENKEVNEKLNQVLKKFLIHLSPHLLLQPAHKCLEWLLRRFNINEYNKDELMMLILPYYETKIFVRCIQTMRFSVDDQWCWLKPIQRPGVPLSKTALMNRVASDSSLMKFICDSILYAVDQLDTRAQSLQVYYSFFSITLIGALEVAKINESHISHIYSAIRKGLRSTSIDFCAASLMVIGQLMSRTQLTSKIVSKLVTLLLTQVQHQKLQPDILILLILIYRNQQDAIQTVPDDALAKLVHSKWIPPALAAIDKDGINILPLYLPILTSCFTRAQSNGAEAKDCRKFCEVVLTECFFKPEDAKRVIRCVLDAYVLPEKDEIIEIQSDNEDEPMDEASDKQFRKWYTARLKALERRYSNIFDSVIKEIIAADDKSISEQKRKALKTVLSFLFTVACSGENVNLFEQLYHYDAQHRIEAVKFLVKNVEKMSFSDDSKSLLNDSISERISDDSPDVVNEVLKFDTNKLKAWMDEKDLHAKLMTILRKALIQPGIWEATGTLAIKHLTSLKVSKSDSVEMLVEILPLLLQPSTLSIDFVHRILSSSLGNQLEFIKACKVATAKISSNKDELFDCILQQFERKSGLPSTEKIVEYIKQLNGDEIPLHKAFYSMLLLTYSINANISYAMGLDILQIVQRFQSLFKMTFCNNKNKWTLTVALGSYPLDINLLCIKNIIDAINWKAMSGKFIDFSQADAGTFLLHGFFEYFIVAIQKYQQKKKRLDIFSGSLEHYFEKVFPKLERRVEFLSNYYVADALPSNTNDAYEINVPSETQTFIIRQLNAIFEENIGGTDKICGLHTFIRLLSALRSSDTSVRETALDSLEILSKMERFGYSTLISKLRKRHSEMLLDSNQLPLILFTIFKKKQSPDLSANLKEFFNFTQADATKSFLIAQMLESLTHVNTVDILKSIIKPALGILNEAIAQMQRESKGTIVLDESKSIIVQNVLSRFTQQTVPVVKSTADVWKFLLTSAQQYGIQLTKGSKVLPITNTVVDVLNNDLFNQLSVQHQQQIVAALVNCVTYSESIDLPRALTKYFRQLEISAKVGVVLLKEMAKCQSSEPMDVDDCNPPTKQRRSLGGSASNLGADLLRMKAWKCGTTWLEYLQNKQKIVDAHLLIPSLFEILQKCLQFEDQSNVEYVKQLVLACLHDICVTIAPNGENRSDLIPEQIFKIEPVVQCIRGTQNPQTHHHALRLLAHSAQMMPEQVLHNMMDIFTFMGSSVVRHDDAYSFQIITHIIEAIVPILTRLDGSKATAKRNDLVMPVLKVFADIILDVPEHRRLPLYTKLMDTIGVNEYLWMFLIILLESHVTHHVNETTKTTERNTLHIERPQRVEVALALSKEFSCDAIVIASTKLIKFMQKLPVNKPLDDSEKLPADVSALFNVNSISKKQYRHFKYETLKFINSLTSSVEFVNKVVRLNGDQAKAMKELYQEAIITLLTFIPTISKVTEQATESVHVDYWKAILHNCFDTLENIISLLSPNVLLVVVHGLLLKNQLASVRRRVIELLIDKLGRNAGEFNQENETELLNLIDPLTKIIQSIRSAPVQTNENISIQQMAMMAIKLLSRQLAEKHPNTFKPIMDILIDTLRQHETSPRLLLATSILSFAEIACNLRVRSIVYLPSFMKLYVKILEHQAQSAITLTDNFIVSAIAALQKIVSTLANYLSPYLTDLIVNLSILWHQIEERSDLKGSDATLDKLNGIWEKLATTLELRVLIPTIDKSYEKIVKTAKRQGIKPVMQLLSSTFKQSPSSDISAFMPDITTFFVSALQYRANTTAAVDLTNVNATEDAIIASFTTLTLKLSEGSFRPLYHQIYDFTMRQNNDNVDRMITYFRLSSEIAKSLKSLFVLFATEFIDDAATLLSKSLEAKPSDRTDRNKTELLVKSVLDTLGLVFLHDSRGFINEQRFETLLQPLVDQIENEIVLESTQLKEILSSTLAQLGVALNDDIRWKQLNYQILMKTRNNESHIRLYALRVIVGLAAKLGEDYMPLLPDTVPFISELLEDESTETEKQCQQSVQELEKILGEPLQKYF